MFTEISRSEEVRRLAARQGVSERTIWRWLADDTLERRETDWVCLTCDRPLPADATIRREYCDGTCRQAAYRRTAAYR